MRGARWGAGMPGRNIYFEFRYIFAIEGRAGKGHPRQPRARVGSSGPEGTMASGGATEAGTATYARRFPENAARGHFREALGLHLSSVGLGTYLGRADEAGGEAYRQAIAAAVAGGVHVLDTAVNHRGERGERALGAPLADVPAAGLPREGGGGAAPGGYG